MTDDVKRIVVVGGLGLFGRTAVEQLRDLGLSVITASRGPAADWRIDANDPESIRATMRRGDLVLDAAGPFHARSTALIEAATEVGFDVIDINDDLGYAERVLALERRIDGAGIRVLSSASSVSALAASVVRRSGIAEPVRMSAFLAPATRHTANAGTALSLLRSVGRPIRVFRDGRLQTVPGWSEPRSFDMPAPISPICGRLFESADALYLPRIWPTLRDVAMYVDTNLPGTNALMRLAARWPAMKRLMEQAVGLGTRVARRFGSQAGGIGYEIEDDEGRVARLAIFSENKSFVVAVAPAVLAARAIVDGRFAARGFVSPDRHVESTNLFEFLAASGITSAALT